MEIQKEGPQNFEALAGEERGSRIDCAFSLSKRSMMRFISTIIIRINSSDLQSELKDMDKKEEERKKTPTPPEDDDH